MEPVLCAEAHAADTLYLTNVGVTKGAHVMSILTPPLYTAFVIARRGRGAWTLNRFLRAAWVGEIAGCAMGGGAAYARYSNSSFESVRRRRIEEEYDTSRIRAQDYSIVGTIVMAVLTPALLWNRAGKINLILGGSSLGAAIGTLTHYGKALSGDVPKKVDLTTKQKPVAAPEVVVVSKD